MSRPRRLLAVAIAAFSLGCTATLLGQVAPRFRAQTDLVTLDVCVKNRAGQFVHELGESDFVVFDERVPQKLTFFAAESRVPLAVVLLIDHSRSMEGQKLESAKVAAAAFVRTLQPGDLVEVLGFGTDTRRVFALGADLAGAEQSIATITAGGLTSLYDSVLVSLHDLDRSPMTRDADYQRALVVLSDGDDTSSHLAFDDVLDEARRSSVVVHAVSLRTDLRDRWLAAGYQLSQLASDTGGRAVGIRGLDELVPIYLEIGAELRHQYRLAFVPSSNLKDGRWHQLSVRTSDRSLVVRTRSGYYAPRANAWMGRD